MFGIFKSVDSIRKSYVDAQNVYYRNSNYNALASYEDEVFTIIWDLRFMANQFGTDTRTLESEISNSNFRFPDTPEDWVLKKILIENKFEVYKLCYRTEDNRLLTLHNTRL